MASNLIYVEENVLCSALKWLVLNKQLPDGSFKEDAAVVHRNMVGDVQGKDADASLTAFVLIAMQESSRICVQSAGDLHDSVRKAVGYLEGKLQKLSNPYAVAMTSYAMANAEKLNNDVLMKHSTKQEGTAWIVPGQHYHSLEATAYAVLALVKAKQYDKAGEAVHWLASQQSHYGGSGTTQATIMVFQAVAEYHTQVRNEQNFNLEVQLSVEGRSKPVKWAFRKDNVHVSRMDKMHLDKSFNITARGTGAATLSIINRYYIKTLEKTTDCKQFDLTLKMIKESNVSYEGALESYLLTIEFISKSKSENVTMTILDVGFLTEFIVDERDFKELTTGGPKFFQQHELGRFFSYHGSLLIYFDKVSHSDSKSISLRVHKRNEVGLLQPAAVTIYDYYSPDARCTKYYHPEREDGALLRLCQGDVCHCAEENCSYQKKNHVNEAERILTACESGMDYVYKVTVVGLTLDQHVDVYNMKVDQVLKTETGEIAEDQVRAFLAHPNCRKSLDFHKGKSYLIMGKISLQYILGEQTWIEYWPTEEEGQSPEHRDRYLGISKFASSLLTVGCYTK